MHTYREVQRGKATRRWPTRHIGKFIAVGIATCSRSSRIYRASYAAEPGRPWVDVKAKVFHRSAPDEKVARNKRAPPAALSDRIARWMDCWSKGGDRYICEWAGRAADTKKAFASTVLRARKAYPHLFRRDDGTPKHIVRHTLRHTGVTWYALAGVDPYEICSFAGMNMETFERVYAHHHPTFQAGIKAAGDRKSRPLARRPKPLLLPAPLAVAAE